MQIQAKRILARNVARELTADEIGQVAGGPGSEAGWYQMNTNTTAHGNDCSTDCVYRETAPTYAEVMDGV